ncbi:MAG: hypothetical protein EBZ45_06955 [Actinobacteria bacterium]|nr:hypothetical protein [Actinomycetota bacterium]
MDIQLPPPPQCRFCLENEATQENPLIEPCRCRGSPSAPSAGASD